MDGEEIGWWGVLQISTRDGGTPRIFLLDGWGYLWKCTTRLGGDQESSGGMNKEESHGECKLQLQEEGKGVEEAWQGVAKVKVRVDELKEDCGGTRDLSFSWVC